MTETYGKIIDDIIVKIANASGKQVEESRISERAVLSDLMDARIYLLHEKYLKARRYTDFDIQTIPCASLQQASISECPFIPGGGKKVLRTVNPVPKPLMGQFEAVTTLEGNIELDYIKWESISDYEGGRFNFDNFLAYTYQNVGNKIHIYVLNTIQDKAIAVKLLAEDPLEVLMFPECNDTSIKKCIDILEQSFPLDKDLLRICKEMVITSYLDPRKNQMRGDYIQDNIDNTVIPHPTNK